MGSGSGGTVPVIAGNRNGVKGGNGHRSAVAPMPRLEGAVVVAEPPGDGPGYWAGAPSAVLADGVYYLAYRLRRPIGKGRGFATVVARSEDGERFEPLLVVDKDEFGAESLERPALAIAPDGGWRLYMSCATPGTLHWRVDVLEAANPAGFDPARRRTVLPGNEATAVKDPVIVWAGGRWHLWASCHPLAVPADADQMVTAYATSADGLDWSWHGTALTGRQGSWDARGVRITSVLLNGYRSVAYYDGRASAAENFEERTGLAAGTGPGAFRQMDRQPLGSPHGAGGLRYLSMVRLPDGGHRLYYEATRQDGAHELRTEYLALST